MNTPFDCDRCYDGTVQAMYGVGRTMLDGVPIPTFFLVMTCEHCGETYRTEAECQQLEDLAKARN